MTTDLDKMGKCEGVGDPAVTATEARSDTELKSTSPTGRSHSRITLVALAVVLAAVVTAGVASLQWYSVSAELASDRAESADRETAVETANAYTERSLTYAHSDLDAFFAGVEDGTTDSLKERFDGVRDVLSQIMTQSQVVASGTVNAATVASQDGDTYTVTVFATQTTQNLQQLEPGVVPTLLTVTVEHAGDQWLVSDYGADTGQ